MYGRNHDPVRMQQMKRIGDTCDIRHRIQCAHFMIVNFLYGTSVCFCFRLCDSIINRTGMSFHFPGQLHSVDQFRNPHR